MPVAAAALSAMLPALRWPLRYMLPSVLPSVLPFQALRAKSSTNFPGSPADLLQVAEGHIVKLQEFLVACQIALAAHAGANDLRFEFRVGDGGPHMGRAENFGQIRQPDALAGILLFGRLLQERPDEIRYYYLLKVPQPPPSTPRVAILVDQRATRRSRAPRYSTVGVVARGA